MPDKYIDVKLETREGTPKTYIVTGFKKTPKGNMMTLLYSGFSKRKAKRIYKKYNTEGSMK